MPVNMMEGRALVGDVDVDGYCCSREVVTEI